MFCSQCGVEEKREVRFCEKCGTAFLNATAQPRTQPAGALADSHWNSQTPAPFGDSVQRPIENHRIEHAPSEVIEAAIWNPGAAAGWSIIFSPAFGSYVQMLNWRALGEWDKADSAQNWFRVSIGMLVVYVLIALFVDDSKAGDGAIQSLGFLFLLVWYFVAGRAQVLYVKRNFGSDYARRAWGKPLLIGVSAFVGYILASVILAAIVGILIGITGLG